MNAINTMNWTIAPAPGYRPPTNSIDVRAIETKAGWKGQIGIAGEIAWEGTEGHEFQSDALDEARERVMKKLAKLFA